MEGSLFLPHLIYLLTLVKGKLSMYCEWTSSVKQEQTFSATANIYKNKNYNM